MARHLATCFFLTLANDGRDVHADHNAFDAINHKAMSLPVHVTFVIMLRKETFKTLKTNLIDHKLLPMPRHIKTFKKLIKS